MKADATAPLQLVAAIERATHLLSLHLERETGVTQAEAHILARLGRGGPSSPSELHRLFGHTRSTVTSVLDRLEARGYVKRDVNPSDRRSFVISLTRSGKTAAARVLHVVDDLEGRIGKAASPRDLEGLAAVLAALENELATTKPVTRVRGRASR
jgi:DNA-binding MarR family transcriptional regulator